MKSTKKSLFLSTISLVLCFAMLLGTTWAWFTDEVTSGVNQIKAGNLDVELWHTSKSVTTATEIKNGDENLLFQDVALWEPGAYAYETFTIKNVGNLALKYSMALNVASYTSYEGHDLTEVLKVKVVDEAPTSRPSYTDGFALEAWSLDSANQPLYPVGNVPENGASEKTFTVVIYWEPTDNDNLYNMNNGRPQPLSVDLGVQLVATQLEYENDSFDNTYDHDADNTLDPATKIETAMASAVVVANQPTVFTTKNTPSGESGKTTTVTVPSTVASFTAGSTSTMTVEATPTLAANHTFTVSSNNGAVGAIDLTVKVNDVVVEQFKNESGEAIPVTVETYVAKNMTNVTLAYNGTGDPPTLVSYEKETGKLVFTTTHFSTFVLGADEVAYVEETNMAYKTLNEAFGAANNTQTIYLLKDFTHSCANNCIDILTNTVRTLDINGKTMTVTGATTAATYRLFDVFGTLDIVDTAATKGELKNSSATGKNGYAFIMVNANGKLTATGVKISSTENRDTIQTNGSASPVDITLKDCTINGRCYFPAGGTYTIDGGTYAGRLGAFYFKSATINIMGGSFSSVGTDGDWYHHDSGCGFTGEGVVVEACNYPAGNPVVNITGGTFTGGAGGAAYKNYGLLIINYNGNTADMTGTTVDYQLATIDAANWHNVSGYVIPGTALNSSAHFHHFTDENTTLVTPNAG